MRVNSKQVEAYMESYVNHIELLREELDLSELSSLTEELFSIYEQTGSRLEYEKVYFKRRQYLAVYGILSMIYSDQKKKDVNLLNELEYILMHICSEEFWGLPAHVNREEDMDWRISIDLFAAETASALAEIITMLKDELSYEVYHLVRENIFTRVLNPYYNSKIPYKGWEVSEHNWSAVCSGSIGIATIYMTEEYLLEKDKKHILTETHRISYIDKNTITTHIERICKSLSYYIKGFHEDGVCMEGLHYFTYGMTYYIAFADLLKRYSNNRINLFNNEKLNRIARFQESCYFSSGQTVSFSDGSNKDRFRFGLSAKLAMTYDNVNLANMKQVASFDFDTCYRFVGLYRDYVWAKEYFGYAREMEANMSRSTKSDPEYSTRGHSVFMDSQWSISESKNGIGVAIKGGHNDEPHNHNDIASFLYVNKGDMLLLDLGAGEYTKDYFSEKRYNIFCNRSISHNVPLINGQEQRSGKNYKASRFDSNGDGETIIEFASAYEEGLIDKLERVIHHDLEEGKVVIEDRFYASSNTIKITENFVCGFRPDICENRITISGPNASINLIIEDYTSLGVSIDIKEEKHSNHEGVEEVIYRIQIDIEMNEKKEECLVFRMRIEESGECNE